MTWSQSVLKSQIGPEKVPIFPLSPEKAMSAKSMKSMQYQSLFWPFFGQSSDFTAIHQHHAISYKSIPSVLVLPK